MAKSASQLFRLAIIRPTRMLLFLPIVSLLSIYMAIVYSYLYLLFTTFTAVFEDQYNFSTRQAGLAYLGLGVGFIVGQIGVGAFSDNYLKKKASPGGVLKPEHRLPPLLVGTFLVPAGLLWYGWSAQYHTHWLVPIVGTSFIGVGTLLAFLPIQMYLVDSYGIYAVSAVATNAFLRSLVGAVIPLAGGRLYARLGLGWGNSLLAIHRSRFFTAAILPDPIRRASQDAFTISDHLIMARSLTRIDMRAQVERRDLLDRHVVHQEWRFIFWLSTFVEFGGYRYGGSLK